MKVKEFLKYIVFRMIAGITKVFYLRKKLEKKVVFTAFSGLRYDCNPRAISEKLNIMYPNYRQIWLMKEFDSRIPDYITQIKYGSVKMFKELLTAKVWVDNGTKSLWINKRRGQLFIQTWHGGLGFKKMGTDAQSGFNKIDELRDKHSMSMTNILLSDSKSMTEVYKGVWPYYKGKILECGFPRTDILYDIDKRKEIATEVRKELDIPNDTVLVLYAPTYRNNDDISVYKMDYNRIINELKNKLGRNVVFAIKLHNWSKHLIYKLNCFSDTVINATDYPNMQKISIAADYFITDYSSGIFDFAIQRKPAFIYANDLENYVNHERGLYFDIKNMPFPFSNDTDELISNMINLSVEDYIEKLNLFYKEMGFVDTPNSSEKICKLINRFIVDY
ncbi:MAG: CDP-glycerol glycerophosphotransferase family protein [Lachnospiraceae bacterium]|nr:CDP-glycerol glycerophosphotransferase family protein [Lachnospiraceae bacterium]